MPKKLNNTTVATPRRTVTSTKMQQEDIRVNLAKSLPKLTRDKVEDYMYHMWNNEISESDTEKIIKNFGKYLQNLDNTRLDGEDTQAISEATTVSKIHFIEDLLNIANRQSLRVDIREKRIAGTKNRVDRLIMNKKAEETYNVIIEDKKVSHGTRRETVNGLIGLRKLEANYLDGTLANVIEKQVGQYNNKNYQMGLGSITIVNNGIDYYATIKKTVLAYDQYDEEEDTNLLDGTKIVYDVHPAEIWKKYSKTNSKAKKHRIVLDAQKEFTALRNIILAGTEYTNGSRKHMLDGIANIYRNAYNKVSRTATNELTRNGIGSDKVSDNKVARLFGLRF